MSGLTNNVVYVNRNLLGVDDNGNILQLGLPVGDGTLRLPEVVVKPSYIPTYNDIENQFGRKVTLQDIDNTIAMDPRIKLETPSIPTEKGMVSLTFLSPFIRMAFIDAPAAAANYTVNKFGLPAVAPYAPMPTDGEALFDLPAYGSVANVLKQGTKGAAKMFSNWATEREIKNTINLRIKSWDATLPNHTISLGNGRLQFRTPTYLVYTGPKHSISEIINPDGSVNIKNIFKVLNDALNNIPGGTIARHRLENKDFHITDWNTFLHSRDAYQRAMAALYPEEARFPVLMHDFGKMWAGDGHGPYGASILEQMFPDATKELIAAIAEHMDSMPQSALGKLVKGADISESNQFRDDVKNLTSLLNTRLKPRTSHIQGDEAVLMFKQYGGTKIPANSINGQLLRKYVAEARERYGLIGNTDITDEEIAQALYKQVNELGSGSAAVNAQGEPLLLFRGDTKPYTTLRTNHDKINDSGTPDNVLGTMFLDRTGIGEGFGPDRYLYLANQENLVMLPYRSGIKTGYFSDLNPVFKKDYVVDFNGKGFVDDADVAYPYWKTENRRGTLSGSKISSDAFTDGNVNLLNGFVVRTPKVRDISNLVYTAGILRLPSETELFLWLIPYKGSPASATRDINIAQNRAVVNGALKEKQGLLRSKAGSPYRDEHSEYDYLVVPDFNARNVKHILPYDLRIPRNWNDPNIFRLSVPLIGGTTLINNNNNEQPK